MKWIRSKMEADIVLTTLLITTFLVVFTVSGFYLFMRGHR